MNFSKLLSTAAFSAICALAADAPKPPAVPQINTAKYWRLNSRVQNLHAQLSQAETELQQEIAGLAAKCGPNFILGYQQDEKAENAGDIICVPKPPAPAPAAPAKGGK